MIYFVETQQGNGFAFESELASVQAILERLRHGPLLVSKLIYDKETSANGEVRRVIRGRIGVSLRSANCREIKETPLRFVERDAA